MRGVRSAQTVALKWDERGEVTEWKAPWSWVSPRRCAPYRANQKGSVENLVGWVKGSFFKQRRFHDRGDLVDQLREWLHETNDQRPNRAR